jgi:hypothetical protein
MKKVIQDLRALLCAWRIIRSPAFGLVMRNIVRVEADGALQKFAAREGKISYCPRCGQIPQRDLRHEEVFEAATSAGYSGPAHVLNAAIELAILARRGFRG